MFPGQLHGALSLEGPVFNALLSPSEVLTDLVEGAPHVHLALLVLILFCSRFSFVKILIL